MKRGRPIVIHDDGNRMQIVTINIPKIYLKLIEVLIDEEKGIYTSRCELIRTALRDFLKREIGFKEKVEETVENYLEKNGIKIIGEA